MWPGCESMCRLVIHSQVTSVFCHKKTYLPFGGGPHAAGRDSMGQLHIESIHVCTWSLCILKGTRRSAMKTESTTDSCLGMRWYVMHVVRPPADTTSAFASFTCLHEHARPVTKP